MRLVGFITKKFEICYEARSHERKIIFFFFLKCGAMM